MPRLDALRDALPDHARDTRLNLPAVLGEGTSLSPAQRWGVAVAVAAGLRDKALTDALAADALEAGVTEATLADAYSAASIMAMNNVYYRFRHLVGKPSYREKPPRLRMNALGRPASSKVDLELFCLAVSAVNGCGDCVTSHEATLLQSGATEDQVHDAVRVAAVVHAATVARALAG